jgi:hypothetical protein
MKRDETPPTTGERRTSSAAHALEVLNRTMTRLAERTGRPPPPPMPVEEAPPEPAGIPCGSLRLASGLRQSRCTFEPWTDEATGRRWLRCTRCLSVMDPKEPERAAAARAGRVPR